MAALFNRDGTIAVNKRRFPTLYRCLERGLKRNLEGWARVVELRLAGKHDSADRVAKKLLGVQGPPMSEEVKEKLRRYNAEHADEIKTRRRTQAAIRKAASKPRGGRR